MESVANMMTSFRIPEHTREEWDAINAEVEAWERENKHKEALERISRAGIPPEFAAADYMHPKAEAWANSPTIGLLLHGKPGRGKTYQACAALKIMARFGTVKFATFDDLKHDCKDCMNGRERESEMIARYLVPRTLLIDDFGKESATSWFIPIMFEVIKKRSERLKATILTTNHTGAELRAKLTVDGDEVRADAFMSRLSAYTAVEITGEDRRRNLKNNS